MRQKHTHTDYSVFPLAILLMAGPATIIISLIFFAKASGDYMSQGIVLAIIALSMFLSYIAFLGTKGAETLSLGRISDRRGFVLQACLPLQ